MVGKRLKKIFGYDRVRTRNKLSASALKSLCLCACVFAKAVQILECGRSVQAKAISGPSASTMRGGVWT